MRYATPEAQALTQKFAPREPARKEPGGRTGPTCLEPIERRAPTANEVEVEVQATGLNFRDVMWALSILPDEMLEDGFAGPTLGLEFAGRVVASGRRSSAYGLAMRWSD